MTETTPILDADDGHDLLWFIGIVFAIFMGLAVIGTFTVLKWCLT